MKSVKSQSMLNSHTMKKNRSFNSFHSQTRSTKTPHFNHTVLDYVQKRLQEIQLKSYDSNPDKQINLLKHDNKGFVSPKNPPYVLHNKSITKKPNEVKKPLVVEPRLKPQLFSNRFSQRSQSKGHSEVVILKQENKKLRDELQLCQSQILRLERKMNELTHYDTNTLRDESSLRNINNKNMNNNNLDNTINSLSVSIIDDYTNDEITDKPLKDKPKNAIAYSNIYKH